MINEVLVFADYGNLGGVFAAEVWAFSEEYFAVEVFLVEYAFWGFVGLNGQGGGGFLVGVFKVKSVGGGPTASNL